MRIRTIKPEFWASESNSRLSRDARLLFVGLLSLADNEGRLRGHPGFIAGQVFPFDADARKVVDRGLDELEAEGKLRRYVADGDAYILVTKFTTHQKVDTRFPSKLPPPPDPHANLTPVHTDCTPVHAKLTPLEQGTGNREVEQGTGNVQREKLARTPAVALADAWNAVITPPLAKVADVERLGKVRQKACLAALMRRPLDEWRTVFERINASSFCRGADGGWRASLDWAIRAEGRKPETAQLVLEGNYDRGPPPGSAFVGSGPLIATEGAI